MLNKRLRGIRAELKYSQKYVAEQLYISQQAYAKYETGASTPNPEMLLKIAELFNVSVDYLVGMTDERPAIPSGAHKDLRPVYTRRFRLLGAVACGEPIYSPEDYDAYVDASAEIKADFCLTAKGDSMINARINDGDVVFIRQQSIVDNGQIAAVVVDGELMLKRWYFYPDQRKLVLNSENPAYEPYVFVDEELDHIQCLGRAVSFMSNL